LGELQLSSESLSTPAAYPFGFAAVPPIVIVTSKNATIKVLNRYFMVFFKFMAFLKIIKNENGLKNRHCRMKVVMFFSHRGTESRRGVKQGEIFPVSLRLRVKFRPQIPGSKHMTQNPNVFRRTLEKSNDFLYNHNG